MEWIILQWTRVWYNNDLYQQAILESTMVTNLDTGEVIPLSAAEERIPQGHGWSPLSEHLIRRAKELSEVLVTLCMPHPSVCMYVCVSCSEGQPRSSYDDDYAPHRRKLRKKGFLKKWGKRRDRLGHETAAQFDESAPNAEDKFSVKVRA